MAEIKKKLDDFVAEHLVKERLENVIGDRFGRYSKYIIQERAIPDVRDGLKPVQRRILYAMNALGITSKSPYKKCARITGEVMGKYHPHGDSSIYEAMVRMSQPWKMSVCLIDIHGNNGSIDGDGPAAYRYTEARLSKNADYLLKDIDKNTVPFIPNFDEEETEPTVLPAKFPNLLVNGSMGISSGYATYIPTHNINEVITATIALIDNPQMNVDDLLKIMPGPDFPTGGIVQGHDGIREAFLTGSGTVVVRSKYFIEDINKDQKRIVVSEIPYDTFKQQTVAKIEQLRLDGKVQDISEVRDESDREGLRIAIDLKKNANVDAIVNYLFKNTDLQINLKYNMTVICDKRPVKLGVLPILSAYIEHAKEVVTNRTNFLLNKDSKRLHIVEGLCKMTSIVDEVIQVIKASKNKADSKVNLMDKFGFTELQAEAIVTLQLYRLSNTDIVALMEEDKELKENIKGYNKILSSEKELLKVIRKELEEVNKELVCPRRTVIEHEVSDLSIDETDLISKEQVMVCVSKEGYLKRITVKSYNKSTNNVLKDTDSVIFFNEVSTLDTLIMFTTLGNYIYLPVYKIPECKMKDNGTFINSLVTINPKEKIITVFAFDKLDSNKTVLLATNFGAMKQTLLSDFEVNRYTKTIRAMKLGMDEELVSADITDNPLEVMVATKKCEVLRFRASDISLYGTQAGGVKSIKLKDGDSVVQAFYTNKENDLLLLTNRGYLKRMKVTDVPLTKRSRAGNAVIKLVKSNPHQLVDAKALTPNQYKENVKLNIVYSSGNDELQVFDFKYNVADAGKEILNPACGKPLMLFVAKATTPDEKVSGDYLIEVKEDLFSMDYEDEKPIITSKKSQAKQTSILDDLDAILKQEGVETESKADDTKMAVNSEENTIFNKDYENDKYQVKETKTATIVRRKDNTISPKIDNNDSQKERINFKPISLFDDDDNN